MPRCLVLLSADARVRAASGRPSCVRVVGHVADRFTVRSLNWRESGPAVPRPSYIIQQAVTVRPGTERHALVRGPQRKSGDRGPRLPCDMNCSISRERIAIPPRSAENRATGVDFGSRAVVAYQEPAHVNMRARRRSRVERQMERNQPAFDGPKPARPLLPGTPLLALRTNSAAPTPRTGGT